MKRDSGKYFGLILMVGFGAIAIFRWHQTHLIFFLLLALRDFLAGYFFMKRTPAKLKAGHLVSIMSYVSTAMPLIYLPPTVDIKALLLASDLLAIVGFSIVTLATIELGTSLGISPAQREYVSSGIYKWIKHPMYLGYGIAELGLAMINPINISIWVMSSSLYFWRKRTEQNLLVG